jgi:hypothetical protein
MQAWLAMQPTARELANHIVEKAHSRFPENVRYEGVTWFWRAAQAHALRARTVPQGQNLHLSTLSSLLVQHHATLGTGVDCLRQANLPNHAGKVYGASSVDALAEAYDDLRTYALNDCARRFGYHHFGESFINSEKFWNLVVQTLAAELQRLAPAPAGAVASSA